MSAFYTSLRSSVDRQLGGKGRAMTLRKRTAGAYDPATGAASVVDVDIPCTGATFDFPALLIDGTRVQVGDKKLLLSAEGLSVMPDTADQMLIGGEVFGIKAIQTIGPDGTVVVYRLQIRR